MDNDQLGIFIHCSCFVFNAWICDAYPVLQSRPITDTIPPSSARKLKVQ
ncbi:MAG: hypothetical protein AB2L18_09420 [Anaerolineaceae bacterium]